MVKLQDIARMAGVSKATASLALNGSDRIKDETRARVLEVAQQYNYIPKRYAQTLARGKSGVIGVVTPNVESEFYGNLVQCLDKQIQRRGYTMYLALSNERLDMEEKIVQHFVASDVEGVVVVPLNTPIDGSQVQYIQLLKNQEIPCVFASSYYENAGVPYCMVDLEEGTYRLVTHLLNSGRRNIVFYTGFYRATPTALRIQGYRRAFAAQGLTVDESCLIECEQIDYDYAYALTAHLLDTGRPIDAIIAVNDAMALGAVNLLRRRGHAIPEEIAVAGFDNVNYSRVSPVQITTINQDLDEISWGAVDVLFRQMQASGEIVEKKIVEPEMVVRESTLHL